MHIHWRSNWSYNLASGVELSNYNRRTDRQTDRKQLHKICPSYVASTYNELLNEVQLYIYTHTHKHVVHYLTKSAVSEQDLLPPEQSRQQSQQCMSHWVNANQGTVGGRGGKKSWLDIQISTSCAHRQVRNPQIYCRTVMCFLNFC